MYTVNRIDPHTFQIFDEYNDAIYVVEGKDKALVIDAGMDKLPLKEYIEILTKKELVLALSHGHIDHIGQSGDFDEVYLHPNDKEVYREHMQVNQGHFSNEGLNFKDPRKLKRMLMKFDLGDRVIDVHLFDGHTPGSVIFVDQKNKMIFTGDAMGSGCGVWMQLDSSLQTWNYKQTIHHTLLAFENMGVDTTWKFYGGHGNQEYESQVSEYNRLDIDLLKDMGTLCDKLLKGEIEFEPTEALQQTYKPYYVRYGKAEMIVTKEAVNLMVDEAV